jgi:hypothetical protein
VIKYWGWVSMTLCLLSWFKENNLSEDAVIYALYIWYCYNSLSNSVSHNLFFNFFTVSCTVHGSFTSWGTPASYILEGYSASFSWLELSFVECVWVCLSPVCL